MARFLRSPLIPTLLFCVGHAWLLATRASAADGVAVTINLGQRLQTIEGFGASGAWWHKYVADYPQEKQDQLLDLLYTDKGIGLTIYRYNIPAGGGQEIQDPMRTTATIETAPGKYDLSADRRSLDIMKAVRKRGVEQFILFSNSPPPRLTRNKMTSGGENGGSNMKSGEEPALANYLIDIALLVRDECKLPKVSLSPINEPQWKWGEKWRGQEGCHYTPQEAAAVIRAVVEESQRRKTGLRIEAPESGAWGGTQEYAEAMFANPAVDRQIDEIAFHSYWTNREAKLKVARELRERFPKKKLVMSEYCEMAHGHGVGIDPALHVAEVIHDDLTIGDVVSWQWWLGIGPGGYNDALIYANPKTEKIEPTKRLWVLGQYSRFVRPGFVRVAVKTDDKVRAAGFLSKDGRRVVCVMPNLTEQPVKLDLGIPNFVAKNASFHVTDETRDLAEVERPNLPAITLPPRSVSTLVLDR